MSVHVLDITRHICFSHYADVLQFNFSHYFGSSCWNILRPVSWIWLMYSYFSLLLQFQTTRGSLVLLWRLFPAARGGDGSVPVPLRHAPQQGSVLRDDRSQCGDHAHGSHEDAGHSWRMDPSNHGHAWQVQTSDKIGRPGCVFQQQFIINPVNWQVNFIPGHPQHTVPLLPRHAVRAALRVELSSVAVQSGAYYLQYKVSTHISTHYIYSIY